MVVIRNQKTIEASIDEGKIEIEASLDYTPKIINAEIEGGFLVGGASYGGQYEVTPKAHQQQVLSTKNKVMKQDVVVLKIPYTEVSNTANGKTVIID